MVRSQQVAHSHTLTISNVGGSSYLDHYCDTVFCTIVWCWWCIDFSSFRYLPISLILHFYWDFFKTLWPVAYRFASRHFCKICKSACNRDFLKSTDSSFHFCDGIDLTEWCSDRSNIQNVYFSRCSRIIVAALLSIALISVMVPPSALLHLPIVPATFFLLHSPPEFTFLSAIFFLLDPNPDIAYPCQ